MPSCERIDVFHRREIHSWDSPKGIVMGPIILSSDMDRSKRSRVSGFSWVFFLALVQAFLLISTTSGVAQAQVRSRVRQPIDDSRRVVLHGGRHALARPEFDTGAAGGDLAMDRMLLMLSRSEEQEADLLKLIDEQQDPESANYHQWL